MRLFHRMERSQTFQSNSVLCYVTSWPKVERMEKGKEKRTEKEKGKKRKEEKKTFCIKTSVRTKMWEKGSTKQNREIDSSKPGRCGLIPTQYYPLPKQGVCSTFALRFLNWSSNNIRAN